MNKDVKQAKRVAWAASAVAFLASLGLILDAGSSLLTSAVEHYKRHECGVVAATPAELEGCKEWTSDTK